MHEILICYASACVCDSSSLKFRNAAGKPATAADTLKIAKCFQQPAFSSGWLYLRPLQDKGLQFQRTDTVVSTMH